MARREERQLEMLDIIEMLALGDLGLLDDEEPEELEWSGVNSGSFGQVIEEYQQYDKHGLLPLAGGLRQQPIRWRQDIRNIRAWYNVFYQRHKDKARGSES